MGSTKRIDDYYYLEGEELYTYKFTKDNKVLIYCDERQVAVLSGDKALHFIEEIEEVDEDGEQMLMAKVANNTKNSHSKSLRHERLQKSTKKNRFIDDLE